VRAIAVVEQIVLTDDLGDICVLGHHPEWIKAFGFDSTERSVRAKPPKPGKKRFLLRISFRRGDQASEALGYFFNLRHPASISHVWLWSQAGFYHTLPLYVRAREMNHAKAPLGILPNTLFDAGYHGVMADLVNRKIVINRTSGLGHSRRGRAGNRSGHVRHAPKAESIAEH
jgi:hypothetical protein